MGANNGMEKNHPTLLIILNEERKNDPILGFLKGNHVWQLGPPNHALTLATYVHV
jgi:hypothetical protein